MRTALRERLARSARTAAAAGLLLAAWAAAAALADKPFVPSPGTALARLAARVADGAILPHLGASARRVGLALAIAGLPACAAGLAAGRSRRLDGALSPFVYALHPLPKSAFLPAIMLVFGLGDAAKVTLIALIVFGQLYLSARDASKAVPADLLDSVRALGAGRAAVALHAVVPAALPSLFTALRVGTGTSVAVLFLAETFAAESGLGWYVVDAWARVDYADMYAAVLALAGFGLACNAAIDLAERAACPWARRAA